jgi:hypothetical protein
MTLKRAVLGIQVPCSVPASFWALIPRMAPFSVLTLHVIFVYQYTLSYEGLLSQAQNGEEQL